MSTIFTVITILMINVEIPLPCTYIQFIKIEFVATWNYCCIFGIIFFVFFSQKSNTYISKYMHFCGNDDYTRTFKWVEMSNLVVVKQQF